MILIDQLIRPRKNCLFALSWKEIKRIVQKARHIKFQKMLSNYLYWSDETLWEIFIFQKGTSYFPFNSIKKIKYCDRVMIIQKLFKLHHLMYELTSSEPSIVQYNPRWWNMIIFIIIACTHTHTHTVIDHGDNSESHSQIYSHNTGPF